MEKKKRKSPPLRPLADRLWEKVDRNGPIPAHRPELGPCWAWKGSRDAFGYGRIYAGGSDARTPRAHRVAYELLIGPIPEDLVLHHECHFSPCCNPAHLTPVTEQQNMLLKIAAGRHLVPYETPPDPWAGTRTVGPTPRPVSCTCRKCGKAFSVPVGRFARGEGRYCSTDCYRRDRKPDEERFWAKVDKSGDCWVWTAATDHAGYGVFAIKTDKWHNIRATHFAWALVHGPVPEGMLIRHKTCDNPPCVRLDHLLIGTNDDNRADSVAKGRHAHGDRSGWRLHPERMAKGEAHGNHKLTEVQVREIRRLYAEGDTSYRKLGVAFGVSTMVISRIVRRIDWKHLE